MTIHNAFFVFVDPNSSVSVTIQDQTLIYMNFFLTITDNITSQNIYFSLKSPCITVGNAWIASSFFIPIIYRPFVWTD
jgi:hypothetical protein